MYIYYIEFALISHIEWRSNPQLTSGNHSTFPATKVLEISLVTMFEVGHTSLVNLIQLPGCISRVQVGQHFEGVDPSALTSNVL